MVHNQCDILKKETVPQKQQQGFPLATSVSLCNLSLLDLKHFSCFLSSSTLLASEVTLPQDLMTPLNTPMHNLYWWSTLIFQTCRFETLLQTFVGTNQCYGICWSFHIWRKQYHYILASEICNEEIPSFARGGNNKSAPIYWIENLVTTLFMFLTSRIKYYAALCWRQLTT